MIPDRERQRSPMGVRLNERQYDCYRSVNAKNDMTETPI
jgi:hypothetical protein